MSTQKPSIGRIVHYNPHPNDLMVIQAMGGYSTAPAAAIITAVNSDTSVNLKVITDGPHDLWKPYVMLAQESGEVYSWEWPPRT